MCTFESGLTITSGHPIVHNGEWKYPRDIVSPSTIPCPFIYNLVISSNHIVTINGTELILLGHSYTEGILKNDYLGSRKIREDLEKMPGWQNGLIELNSGCMIKKAGQAVRMVYNGEMKV